MSSPYSSHNATLLAHVKANPGARGEQITSAFAPNLDTIRIPMQKLLAERKVRTQGQRRGMKYFAAGGGDAKSKTAPKAKRKAGNRGAKKAKATGPKALVVEVAAAA